MKSGEVIYATSHADFLNQVFGQNYKAWMKSVWPYNDDAIVWMVRFDGKNRGGWRNFFESKNRIKEENVYKKTVWDGAPISAYTGFKRIVIEIDDSSFRRKYIFRGVYKYDEENSNPRTVRYYDKIADEI